MLKLFNRKKKDNKGFTLVELVVVIAILAILVGLLAPQYTKYVEKSRKSADATNVDELVKAVQVYAVDHAIGQTSTTTTGQGGTATTTKADTTLVIKLTKDGVRDDKGTITTGTLKDAFDEYVPNWNKVTKKSTQWTKDPTATLTIDADGGVKVKYEPADFDTYHGSSAEK